MAPNLLLVIVDDLRADRLGCTGLARAETPYLDALAKRGALYTRCFATSGWTLPSCASIVTGRIPSDHGLIHHDRRFGKPKIPALLPGYATWGVGNNGNLVPDDIPQATLDALKFERRPEMWKRFGWQEGFERYEWFHKEDKDGPFRVFAEFLAGRKTDARPWFAMLHTNLVHDYDHDHPWAVACERFLGRPLSAPMRKFRDGPWVWKDVPPGMTDAQVSEEALAKYDACIAEADKRLAAALAPIDWTTTVAAIVSDHGEGFDGTRDRVHHCGRLHDDLLRVPVILVGAGVAPAVVDAPCSTIDVAATLVRIGGGDASKLPGVDLLAAPGADASAPMRGVVRSASVGATHASPGSVTPAAFDGQPGDACVAPTTARAATASSGEPPSAPVGAGFQPGPAAAAAERTDMGHRSAAPPPGRVGNPPLQALHAGQVLPARDARPPRILHAEDFGYLYLPPTDVAERLRRYDFKDHAVETKAKIVWPYKSIDIRIDRQSWSESYDLDLDPEERVNRARRAQGPTRKPEKDEGALEAKLREWRKAREGPPRFGASPIWNRFVRQVRGERRLPDSEPDRPMPSWLPPHLAARGAYVPMSFIVAVDDPVELRRHVLSSRAFQENGHQWLFVDNRQNRAYSSISKLYAEARRRAEGEFLCFMHQDVLLPPDWDERVTRHLFNELNSHDPNWGVVGVAGRAPRSPAVTDPPNIGHWSDPHRYHEPTVPLPAEVQILDELLMIVRADSGLAFDPDLPGFHCYGADLCLTAREKGMKNYVIDAPVVHKLFRPDGTLIETGDRTHKIANRQTDAFRADFMRSADYVRTKWAKYLPFEGTSYRWT